MTGPWGLAWSSWFGGLGVLLAVTLAYAVIVVRRDRRKK